MDSLGAYLAICGAITIGAISPGPSFIFVARTALASGRGAGVRAAIGMAAAGAFYALIAVLGLAAILNTTPLLFLAVKAVGAAFLGYIGYSMIKHAKLPLAPVGDPKEARGGFWRGLLVQLGNPKTVVVYTSVFAALLPDSPALWLVSALPLSIGAIEGAWYLVVVLVFATARANASYSKAKPLIDRIAGVLMLLLALRLIWPW